VTVGWLEERWSKERNHRGRVRGGRVRPARCRGVPPWLDDPRRELRGRSRLRVEEGARRHDRAGVAPGRVSRACLLGLRRRLQRRTHPRRGPRDPVDSCARHPRHRSRSSAWCSSPGRPCSPDGSGASPTSASSSRKGRERRSGPTPSAGGRPRSPWRC
jgi:hypothetical protein